MNIRRAPLGLFLMVLAVLISCGPKTRPLGVFGESRLEEVLGQDGVTPVPFSENLTLWTFGDTMLGTWKGEVSSSATFTEKTAISSFLSNSLAFTPAPNPQNIENLPFTFYKKNGKVAPFIEYLRSEDPSRVRLWAVDGVRMGNTVYVYYLRITITEPGKFLAFRVSGIGLTRWDIPEGWRPGMGVRFVRLPDLFPGNYPAFGSCVIRRGGYCITVGHCRAPDGSTPVKFARVAAERISDRAGYEFLQEDGGWGRDINRAGSFLGDVIGECSLSYNEAIGRYILIYCRQWTGEIIMVRFGDFSDLRHAKKEVVYRPPVIRAADGAPALYYSGKEIYSWGKTLFAVYINPLEYQPYLLEIRL